MSTKKPQPSRRVRFDLAVHRGWRWLRRRFDGEHFTENLALLAVAVMLVSTIDTRNQADTATDAAHNAIAAARENTAGTCQRARAATATNTLPYAIFDPEARQIRPEDEQVYIDRLLQLRDTLNLGLSRDCAHYGQPPNIDLLLNAKLDEITDRLTPTATMKRRHLKPVPVETVTPHVLNSAAATEAQERSGPRSDPEGVGLEDGLTGGEAPQTPGEAVSPPVTTASPGLASQAVDAVDHLVAPVCDLVRPVLTLC